MPSTIAQILAAAQCSPGGVVRWGMPVLVGGPGVYVVSLDEDLDSLKASRATAPVSGELVERWLAGRPTLALDGRPPSVDDLVQRLSRFWLPDEVILYVGLAGTSLRTRIRQYYSTPLGARSPHAGGHWLKTLEDLTQLYVHFASMPEPAAAERAMLDRFCTSVSDKTRESLFDPVRPLPFANLDWPGHGAKRHGIRGSKVARSEGRDSGGSAGKLARDG